MQISESNWPQPLNTISSVLNDYNDRFSLEHRKSKENLINLTNKRLSKSVNQLNMNFYQSNDTSFKKPSISSLNNLTISKNDLKTDDNFQLNNKFSCSLKDMTKYEHLNSAFQINAQCEKLSNLNFSNCNYDQYVCSRNPQFTSGILNNYNLISSNETTSINSACPTNLINDNLMTRELQNDDQSIKTKELKNFLISTTDDKLKEDDSNNSFYCLSNLINTTNDNQISRFICLWLDCNKTFTLQRDLVSGFC